MRDGNLEVKLDPQYSLRAYRAAVQVNDVTMQSNRSRTPLRYQRIPSELPDR